MGLRGDWPDVILAMDSPTEARLIGMINADEDLEAYGGLGNRFSSQFSFFQALSYIRNVHEACGGCGALGAALRAIDALARDESAWRGRSLQESVAEAQAQQEAVVRAMKFWFSVWRQGPQSLVRLLRRDEVRPYTVSLLRILVRLAEVPGLDGGDGLLVPTLVVADADNPRAVTFG
jgi:hypothetical protein